MTELTDEIDELNTKLNMLKEEISKGIIGQQEVVDSVLKCLICKGHVLLEGVPGLAKTLTVNLMANSISGSDFERIQFTPDLLPSDIVGSEIYRKEKNEFQTQKGPIFANFVLADEINRTTPKVQSAMLQAMAEREVTIGNNTFQLPNPFMVLATQNPLEQAGTFPLAAAQIDRFLFKVYVDYPTKNEEQQIIDINAEVKSTSEFGTERVVDIEDLKKSQSIVRQIKMTDEIKEYILNFVEATRKPKEYGIEDGEYIRYGISARGAISLTLGSKANALMDGRDFVIPKDVREIAPNVLRHRILLNYEGKSLGIKTVDIIDQIINNAEIV